MIIRDEDAIVSVVAGVVIKKDGKYLLIQEKKPQVYGLWNFPAGHVIKGDTIEQTAIKEAKEETGFDVELLRKINVFQENVDQSVRHAFEAQIIGGELKIPEDEILDAKWFTYEEIKAMKDQLRSNWILATLSSLERVSF